MYLYLFLCLQNTGAEIGEFLTPLIFLCHSYKKWTLIYCGTIITQNDADLRGKIFYIFKEHTVYWQLLRPVAIF